MVMITSKREREHHTSSERNKCQGKKRERRQTFLNIQWQSDSLSLKKNQPREVLE